MLKRKIAPVIFLVIAILSYFVFFHEDKTLKFIPKNADAVILINVKKIKRQAVFSFLMHPSGWFKSSKKSDLYSLFRKSGIELPDYLQLFHLKNGKISDWNTVVEIADLNAFLLFLKECKFNKSDNNTYQKDGIFLKIEDEKCLISTSNSNFNYLKKAANNKFFEADEFIGISTGSLSFLSNQKITNFEIECSENEIEIKNSSNTKLFKSVLKSAEAKNQFLDLELDASNIQTFSQFFRNNFQYPSGVLAVKSTVALKQVQDTIITFGYDDNFNEVEKRSFQKIIKPNYFIAFQTSNPDKTWEFFKNKKWINSGNQFTAIPFQPNFINKYGKQIIVNSQEKITKTGNWSKNNYIFLKNDPLFLTFFSSLNAPQKRIISKLDYVFFGNKDENYYILIKFKKSKEAYF
ncbi:hypothetical protein [Halpernia frigidisoli]|uniref:DUF3352 domain-containing protein n=1 Tax=Halpernia frigidisoli TaxID=1125876 RepID=A0A1I3HLK3_9FLAO|nr:hypothetical protein [Halpernia frigidisoli]SFI36513.1 hypothetical protein SAMN05443292_2275 [Halpernia frigidisoli]